jgi:cellulose 1,4-beta-cellobiosidase
MDTIAKVPSLRTYLQSVQDAGTTNVIVPFVVYDLPERDCAAAASNGELSLADDGENRYKTEYIDVIYSTLVDFPGIPVALIIEPDSLANLVTNSGVTKCANAADAYKTLTVYAVQKFATLSNVVQYLDGGHGGWLGWPANLPGAAQLFAQIWKDAGSPSNLRGLATNVANYNGWSLDTW